MIYEKSAGAIVFRREGGKVKFLFLHKDDGDFWDMPKGNVEKGESELEAVKREAKEEAGLDDLKFMEGFKEKVHYFYHREGQTISKDVVFFLAETKMKDVRISWEHTGYEWMDYGKALPLMKKGQKEVLEKAYAFLTGGLNKFVKG